MLELDLYLTPFAEACFEELSRELKQRYRELLEREDPEILDWLKGDESMPSEFVEIVTRIKTFSHSRQYSQH